MTNWPFEHPRTPMEAKVSARFPEPPGWAYEPKWDGFRALAWSGSPGAKLPGAELPGAELPADKLPGDEPRLDSRNRRPLLRYFPELVPALEALPEATVVDGEVIVVIEDATDFEALQQRIHPAASRIARLAAETPAQLVAFDLLTLRGEDLRARPFEERREKLRAVLGELGPPWSLTPSTRDLDEARRWHVAFEAAGCDGIVAKRLDGRYVEGKREMLKIKHRRTVDVVIGGYRVHKEGDRIGSLLLGLYDPSGQMHFVGHSSGFSDEDRVALLRRFEQLRSDDSFGSPDAGARRPGAESRWARGRDTDWVPVEPAVVAEVSYDQVTAGRFRHATRLERCRPDKDAAECTLDQLARPEGVGFGKVVAGAPA